MRVYNVKLIAEFNLKEVSANSVKEAEKKAFEVASGASKKLVAFKPVILSVKAKENKT